MANNNLQPISIASLLDGRMFLIPSYQRGFRWGKKQVDDLLTDLLKFTLKKEKQNGEFYCLQPIIVQPIRDISEYKSLIVDLDSGIKAWEVVDGQQRLTSIFILIRCLMSICKIEKEDFYNDYNGKRLYHIVYETRLDDIDFIEGLNKETLDKADNIDTSHIADAYKEIERWIRNEGIELSKKLNGPESAKQIANKMMDLLVSTGNKNNTDGSVQVIWYEISPDEHKNPIDEFLKINNGMIRLTDAELIKALFLQKHNFAFSEQEIKQIEIALQWEQIENTLHRSDFWSCFSQNEEQEDNRISLLLNLVFQNENEGRLPVEDGDLFRFFNDKFDAEDSHLQHVIKNVWYEIVKWFRHMEDWYEDPIIYNYIGLLSRYNITLYDITKAYETLEIDSTHTDFVNLLKTKVGSVLKKIKTDSDSIDLQYGKHNILIRQLLLFLNVNWKNKQLLAIRSKENQEGYVSPIYKFPFDMFDKQKWDVEHIDSATTNALKTEDSQIEWIKQACIELSSEISEADNNTIQQLIEEKKYKVAINKLQTLAEEDEDDKNWIGNLTLLDYQTNRSYGNSLFSEKRRIIQDRSTNGVFVPECTLLVFNKQVGNKNEKSILKWTKEDKKEYHHFILNELQQFFNSK